MKIVVTGATGGLGLTACEHLLNHGVQVHGIGRQEEKVAHLVARGMKFTRVDLGTARVQDVLPATQWADAVWHCAALSSPWGPTNEFYRSNVRATQTMLSAATACSVPRFVHVSTPAVYFDYQHHRNIPEGYQSRAFVNEYAHTKHLAENLVREATRNRSLQAVVLRPRALFGPRDQVLLPRLLAVAKKRKGVLPLPNGGKTLLDLTYIDNVVQAMWHATAIDGSNLPRYDVFNITNDDPRYLSDVLTNLSAQLGSPFTIKPVKYEAMFAAACAMEALSAITRREPLLTRYSVGALAFDMTLDITKAKRMLGFTPAVSFDEGLARTVDALKAAGAV